MNLGAGPGQHADEFVNAEEFDPAPHQVTDTRLGDPEELGRLLLSEPTSLDELPDIHHKLCANPEVLRLVSGKAQIREDVAAGAGDPQLLGVGHGYFRLRGRTPRLRC